MKYAIPCMCLEESKPLNLPLAQFKRPGFSTLDTPFEYRDLFTPLCLVKDVVNRSSVFFSSHVSYPVGQGRSQVSKCPHIYLC